MARFVSGCIAFTCALIVFESGECRHGGPSQIPFAVEEQKGPWFTGPLLTPSGHVVPIGFMNIEPYFFFTETYGAYNSHWHAHSVTKTFDFNPIFSFQIGVTEKIDFQTSPEIFYTRKKDKASTQFGDLPLGFDYQILKDTRDDWWPALKFAIRESFPTGKYQKLNPKKLGTDGVGSGSYITGVGFVISRLFHTGGVHYLNSRLSFQYNIPSNVHVKGFNVYGGAEDTKGTVHPGNTFSTLLGLEYSMTLHWALALDVANVYGNKTTFRGKRGTNADGTPATVGGPSFDQISLAPAIEYNFNESVGIIAGAWFTVAGRNTQQFASGVIAVNWYTAIKKQKKPQPFYFPQGGKFN